MEQRHLYWIYALGFFAQGLFGARLIVQLVISERKGKVTSPAVFWHLSLMASFLFLIYGILRDDAVIILGQTISYYIYIRNLQLKHRWLTIPKILRWILLVLPVLAFSWIIRSLENIESVMRANDLSHPLLILGAVGQLMLNLRFLYQWYYSEQQNESILPLGFWVISTVASVFVIVYAGYRLDPVLLVAQGMGIFVYARNMILDYRSKH